MSSAPSLTTSHAGTRAVRHELTFLNVFRVIQALVYVSLAFTPMGLGWPQLGNLGFAGYVTTLYLLFALIMLGLNRRSMAFITLTVSASLVVDIAVAVLAISAMNDTRIGISMMRAANRCAGALIRPLR